MSTTIGVELPAHPFFLATLFVPRSTSLPERRQSVKSWRCSPGSYLANESKVAGGRMRSPNRGYWSTGRTDC